MRASTFGIGTTGGCGKQRESSRMKPLRAVAASARASQPAALAIARRGQGTFAECILRPTTHGPELAAGTVVGFDAGTTSSATSFNHT